MTCQRCGGYEFVDDGQGGLRDCPACRGDTMYRSPCHGQLVAVLGGRLIGKCWGCITEAQQGSARLARRPAAVTAEAAQATERAEASGA